MKREEEEDEEKTNNIIDIVLENEAYETILECRTNKQR